MNWPAPTLPPPTSTADDLDAATVASAPSPDGDERRGLGAVPAAAWVGIVGGALVLLAAAIVIVSNWDTIGRSARFAGFVVGTGALLLASERLRRIAPTSSGIIAQVGTSLVGGVGIAALSLFGVTWPTCMAVGGAIVAIAAEVQARRWQRDSFRLGQIAGLAVMSTGLADLTGTTGGLIAAIAAAGLLTIGAQRRAAGLAVLALVSPALTALAVAGIGSGTLDRAGLVGDRLSWSGPMVGVMAAMVLGIVATQRRNNGLMLTAALAPVIGLVTGLAAVDGSITAWLGLPALVVIAAELGWWLLPDDRFRRQIANAVNAVAGTLAVVAGVGPALATIDVGNGLVAYPWALPAALTFVALALSTMRLGAADHALADLGIAAGASSLVALTVAFGAPAGLVAVVAVAVVPAAAFLSRRLHPLAIYVPGVWALASIVGLEPASSTANFVLGATLLAALAATVLATRTRIAADHHWIGWFELTVVTGALATVAVAFVPAHAPAAALALGSVAAATIMAIERRLTIWGVVLIGGIGLVTTDAAIATTSLDPTYWVGWAVAALALAAAWMSTRDPITSHAAAAAATIAAAASTAALPVSAEQFIGLAMIAVAVLTGLAFVTPRRSPLDAAAVTAGVLLLGTTGFDVDPAWISAVWVVLGLQIAALGALVRRPPISIGGALVTATAGASWWFTSGLHDWFVEAIAPADLTAGDFWAAAASIMALVAGVAVRRQFAVNSWIAYSGSLAVPGLWLTAVQIERDTVWALPLAITIGLAGVALGGWHRLAAPLVLGTTLTAVSVFVASGSDLRAIPVWTWLAVGGAGLLGLAVLIERGTDGRKALSERWQ